jgi:holo-[acyl-carrier protein] synthase
MRAPHGSSHRAFNEKSQPISILQDHPRFAIIEEETAASMGQTSMDIVAIGSNIVECVRIGRMIEKYGEQFLRRVYTAREVRCCQERRHVTEHFAGHWAAKEAIVKCLGTGWRTSLCWTDIEVRTPPDGPLKVYVCGAAKERAIELRISDILLTISHCRAYATAQAIAVRG